MLEDLLSVSGEPHKRRRHPPNDKKMLTERGTVVRKVVQITNVYGPPLDVEF